MTIDDYLSETGETADALAERSGLSKASLSKIRNGMQNTTIDVVRRIVAASGNRITADSIVHHAGPDSGAAAAPSAGKSGDVTAPLDKAA